MWQEMRKRNMNWSSEGRNIDISKPQKLPENNRTGQSQEALTKGNQSKLMKQRSVNKLWSNAQL